MESKDESSQLSLPGSSVHIKQEISSASDNSHTDLKKEQMDECGTIVGIKKEPAVKYETDLEDTIVDQCNCHEEFCKAGVSITSESNFYEDKKSSEVDPNTERSLFEDSQHVFKFNSNAVVDDPECLIGLSREKHLAGSSSSDIKPYKDYCNDVLEIGHILPQNLEKELLKFSGSSSMKVEERETMYRCSSCQVSISHKDLLYHHKNVHKNEKVSYRRVKENSSKWKLSLLDHTLTPTVEKTYQCDICPKSFCEKKNMLHHRLSHTKQKNYQCIMCKKLFASKYTLFFHCQTVHTSDKPYHCRVCQKSFSAKAYMKSHELTQSKSYQCDICQKFVSNKRTMRRHKMIHTNEVVNEEPMSLPSACDMKGVGKVDLIDQEVKVEPCASSCTEPENIKAEATIDELCHVKAENSNFEFDVKHHGVSDTCVVNSSDNEHIFPRQLEQNVIQSSGSADKLFQCNICYKNFLWKVHLNCHYGRVHTDIRPHQCDICQKSFFRITDLKRHKLTHTKEKLFQCTVCHKSYSLKSYLNQHHQRIHTDLRPYTCAVCQKSFSLNLELKAHQVVHTDEKPYGCDICQKLFSRNKNLKRHKLIHANDKPNLV